MAKKKSSAAKKRQRRLRVGKVVRRLIKQNPKKKALKRRIRKSRPLHRRFLLHPMTVMVLLCVGVFLVSWTFRAIADVITVTGTVPAPILTQGAVITSPADGSTLTTSPDEISGNCPYGSYINLTINNAFSGVAWCTVDNTFSIETDLFDGQNVLSTQDYNLINAPGPTTSPITVTYSPPSNTIVSSSNTTTQSTNSSSTPSLPLVIATNFQFKSFPVNTTYSWNIQINGGAPPYMAYINWGNGQSSVVEVNNSSPFTISHTYTDPGYYAIIVTSVDHKDTRSVIQLAAFVSKPNQHNSFLPGPTTPTTNKPKASSGGISVSQDFSSLPTWLKFAWPSFFIVILMVFSFWLGEKQEYGILFSRARRKRVHVH
jgi:hypothetical protein